METGRVPRKTKLFLTQNSLLWTLRKALLDSTAITLLILPPDERWRPGGKEWLWARGIQRSWAERAACRAPHQDHEGAGEAPALCWAPIPPAVQSSRQSLQPGPESKGDCALLPGEGSRSNAPQGSFPSVYMPRQQVRLWWFQINSPQTT